MPKLSGIVSMCCSKTYAANAGAELDDMYVSSSTSIVAFACTYSAIRAHHPTAVISLRDRLCSGAERA